MRYCVKKLAMIGVALGLSMLAACGDETTEVTKQTGIAMLEAGKSMPECDSESAGDMVYSADSAAVFYCAEGEWQSLNGKDGAEGKAGVAGEKGDSGEKGDKGDVGEKGDKGDAGEKGDKGNPGAEGKATNGTSCTAKSIDAGIEISCGGTIIDTLTNGLSIKGDPGKSAYELSGFVGAEDEWLASLKGAAGVGCSAEDKGDGNVVLTCGEDGTPVTLYKAVCGSEGYEPSKKFCSDGKVYDLCAGVIYDPKREYCLAVTDVDGNDVIKTEKLLTYEGQTYKTVKIGNQVWMAENLNFIPDTTAVKYEGYKGRTWCYENAQDSCAKYGRLYTWAAAMDSAAAFSANGAHCGYGGSCRISEHVRGICPEGWHLPSKDEWGTLFSEIGEEYAGEDLKSSYGWNAGNGIDAYGFSALPAGYAMNIEQFNFSDVGDRALFWSSTEEDDSEAYGIYFYKGNVIAFTGRETKGWGYSVRCLMD